MIESFLLKLKSITTCFEHDIFRNNLKDNIMDKSILTNIFRNNLKDNIMDKSILTNIAGYYQNRNPSQAFLRV